MRTARLALALVTSSLAASLSGCMIDRYPIGMVSPAQPTAKPATRLSPDQTYTMDGSSLFDAKHAVDRYLTKSYPNATLVSVHAQMVGTNARVAKTSAWEFVYRVRNQVLQTVPPATADASGSSTALVPAPTYELVHFTYTGQGQLLAPEEEPDTSATLASLDDARLILLDQAIATALDIGMGVGDPGMDITLRTTVNGGAVYELDSSVGTRQVMSVASCRPVIVNVRTGTGSYGSKGSSGNTYSGGTSYGSSYGGTYYGDSSYEGGGYDYPVDDPYYGAPSRYPTPAPTPKSVYVRGKYLIDAYTGAIIDRPNKL